MLDQILGRLIGAIDQNKDDKAGAKNWWRWPILIVLMLAAVAVFAWISNRDAKELANLRHEKKKAELERDQAQIDALIAKDAAQVELHQKEIDAASARIEKLNKEFQETRDDLAKKIAAIDRVRTWEDVASSAG